MDEEVQESLIPGKIGSWLIALIALVGPFLALMRAFDVEVNEEQYAALMGFAGAVTLIIQRFSGNKPEDNE